MTINPTLNTFIRFIVVSRMFFADGTSEYFHTLALKPDQIGHAIALRKEAVRVVYFGLN